MHTALVILAVVFMFASYGGMHYYLYRKWRWIFPRHKTLLGTVITLLAVSLFAVQILADAGLPQHLAPLVWLPSLWLGYVFLFMVIAGVVDLLLKLLALARPQPPLLRVRQATWALIFSGVTLVVCAAGYLSAQRVQFLTHTLGSTKLREPLTVVQISDLHLGLMSKRPQIENLVARINALQPDIIVSTGDLVDMQSEHLDGYSTILAGLNAGLGKFAVYGNHEAFAGPAKSRAFIERSGFVVLSNQQVALDTRINIVGVDDPAMQGRMFPGAEAEGEGQLLAQTPADGYTLLLKHQPVVAAASKGHFDLQLSGHTHGGQVFPFTLLVNLFYSAPRGLSAVTDSAWLYVSNGTGTWGPPMRILAEPEVSVFYLQPQR